MKIIPYHNRILVKRHVERIEAKHGIIVPDSVQDTPTCEGVIEAVGDETSGKLKEGQRILFEEFSGREIELDDYRYLILAEDSVIGIMEE
jgi:chaperonin GroES